jgi:hypothetical protein
LRRVYGFRPVDIAAAIRALFSSGIDLSDAQGQSARLLSMS